MNTRTLPIWLAKVVAESKAKNAARIVQPLDDLAGSRLGRRVSAWYDALPQEAKEARYTMAALSRFFRAPPAKLGDTLHALGWARKRHYGAGPSYRYWIGPAGDPTRIGGDNHLQSA